MKNVLLFLLSLVLIAGVVEAKIVNDSVYQIPKTKIAPVIDGIQDPVWKTLDWNMQRLYTVDGTGADSGSGLSGMSKAMWDADNLYILFYTIDDIITPIPANRGAAYNQDAVEFYFDGSNDHSTKSGRGPGQYQFTIPYLIKDESGNLGYVFGTTFDTVGCDFKIADVPEEEGFPGFMVEVKIPLASLGVDGASAADQMVGWELQQDESDDATAGRTSMSKWWSGSNNSWQNPALWGYAVLSSREVDTVLQILSTSAAIAVDGTMDAAYKSANTVTTNLYRVGDPYAAGTDVADTDPLFGGLLTAYPLWDATNMYVFIEVVDGIVTPIPANRGASYNQDAIEIYFDGTNDHSTKSGRGPGQYQFTIPYLIKDETGNLGYVFGTTFDTVGCEFKITDRDVRYNEGPLAQAGSGYNVEMKIPLASLGIDGSSPGAELGFELQLDNSNDATAGRQGMEKWWSASNNSWQNPALWGYAKLVSGTVDVEAQSGQVARSFELAQNYPNPFNPSTEISFTLAKSGKVKLSVYNLLGKEVAVLVNGTRNAGPQTVTFNASNLSSGVYFYKLEAGSSVLAKKMMLLK